VRQTGTGQDTAPTHASSDLFSPARSHLPEFPESPKIVAPAGDKAQDTLDMSLLGVTSHPDHYTGVALPGSSAVKLLFFPIFHGC
jgi:hypothetical protein